MAPCGNRPSAALQGHAGCCRQSFPGCRWLDAPVENLSSGIAVEPPEGQSIGLRRFRSSQGIAKRLSHKTVQIGLILHIHEIADGFPGLAFGSQSPKCVDRSPFRLHVVFIAAQGFANDFVGLASRPGPTRRSMKWRSCLVRLRFLLQDAADGLAVLPGLHAPPAHREQRLKRCPLPVPALTVVGPRSAAIAQGTEIEADWPVTRGN